MINDKEFLYQLRRKIILETREIIKKERVKNKPNSSLHKNWAEHQRGQIGIMLESMRGAINGLKIIDVELLKDLEDLYQENISIILKINIQHIESKMLKKDIQNIKFQTLKSKIQNSIESESIPRYRYYDYIFSTIRNIEKFHEINLTDDTYKNRRKAYFNALAVVNEGRSDEVFPEFPSTRISTYRILLKILRANYIRKEIRSQIIKLIKFYFDKDSNGEKYKDITKIREISSKKTKFEKEEYARFEKIFKLKSTDIIDRNE